MTRDEEIGELIGRLMTACRAAVHIDVNQHRNYYETAASYLADQDHDETDAVIAEMIARDTVIEIQAYPRTPVGFVRVLHFDLLEGLRQAVTGAENYDRPRQ